jgi:hypothetical protein
MIIKSAIKVEWLIFQDTNLKEFKNYAFFLLAISIVLSLYTAFFSHMNNWLIFKSSFFHLIEGNSLYRLYPAEHHDLYKYSPSFALLMGPLAILPSWLGGLLWNLIGALLFLWAILILPLNLKNQKSIFWISLPEFIGSTQGFQSNIHMISLLIIFWVALEKQRPLLSSIGLLASFFIKIFGILAACLFLFQKYSIKNLNFLIKTLIWLFIVTILLIFLPLPITGWEGLLFQYQEWLLLLKMDASQSYGFSLMGFLHGVFNIEVNTLILQIMGGLSLILSYLYFQKGNENVRLMGFVALCYFLIVFNHKSESPTFIIAMVAFAIHQSLIANKTLRWFLILFTLGCVSFMYSDLFRSIKQSHLDLYCVKVWPFLILYPMSIFQLNILKNKVSI